MSCWFLKKCQTLHTAFLEQWPCFWPFLVGNIALIQLGELNDPPYFTYGQSGKNIHFDLQNFFQGQNQGQKWPKIWHFIYFIIFYMECFKLLSYNFHRMYLQYFRRYLPSFKALWHILLAGWRSEGWKLTAKLGATFCDIRNVTKLWRAVSPVLFKLESWNFFW